MLIIYIALKDHSLLFLHIFKKYILVLPWSVILIFIFD